MIAREIRIDTPIWGIKGVGLDLSGLKDEEIVAVFVEYRDKHGNLVFPDVYMDSRLALVNKSFTQKKRGKLLNVVALANFNMKLTRQEYAETYPGLGTKSSRTDRTPPGNGEQAA